MKRLRVVVEANITEEEIIEIEEKYGSLDKAFKKHKEKWDDDNRDMLYSVEVVEELEE